MQGFGLQQGLCKFSSIISLEESGTLYDWLFKNEDFYPHFIFAK